MAQAKKLISAVLDLDSALEFSENADPKFSTTGNEEELHKYLAEKFNSTKAGETTLQIEQRKAHFKWILPIVLEEAEEFHKQALKKAKAKDYTGAIHLWIKAISINAVDPDYYFNAGIAFFEKKNYREAIDNLEYALQLCPIYFKARLILGTVYLKLRKFEKAEQHLSESIAFNHTNTLALLNLATATSVLKKYDAGIALFKKITAINPKEVRAFFGLAKIYSLQNNIQDANVCYHKVLEIDPKGPLAPHAKRLIIAEKPAAKELKTNTNINISNYSNLDEMFSEAYSAYLFNDYNLAANLYKKYVSTKSDDEQAWYSLGEASLRCGFIETALNAFQKAAEINSSKALYYKQIALCLDYLERYKEALEAVKKAHEMGKNDSMLLTLYGKALLKNNKADKAVEMLTAALKRNKQNIAAEYHLAEAYIAQKQPDMAAEHLHWIMNSKLKTPLKAKADQLLASIKKES
ncbi:MAG: hypothetical protein DWQ05_09900 [Calditrichaeota bacterium]|nr:MAG: hypothetical protein DWQ05_09900 [Calditrichota bacterium]